MTLANGVYALCMLTSAACAILLLRGYRRSGFRLLLWSGLCFVGLAINNVLLFIDAQLLTITDLSVWRTVPALGGVVILLYGLIWESK